MPLPADFDLNQLTEQELLDLAASNPKVIKIIQDADPRAKLQELLVASDKEYHGKKFRDVLEEMGVMVSPDSNLARTRRPIESAVKPVLEDNAKLRKELAEATGKRTEAEFDASLKAYAREADAEISDEEVGEIRKFMTDNQFGPASAKYAVGVWLESKRPAEPNFEPGLTMPTALQGDEEHRKALLEDEKNGGDLGPNTPRGLAHAEKVWHAMFGKGSRLRSPAFTGS